MIAPGDFMLGDRDGLVRVPRALAETVVDKAEAAMIAENLVRKAILAGEDPQQAYLKYGKFENRPRSRRRLIVGNDPAVVRQRARGDKPDLAAHLASAPAAWRRQRSRALGPRRWRGRSCATSKVSSAIGWTASTLSVFMKLSTLGLS